MLAMEDQTSPATGGPAFSLTTIASKLGSHKVMGHGPASYAKEARLKYKPRSYTDLRNDANLRQHNKPVGASLLAMAVGQARCVLDGLASSRASLAPTGSRIYISST